MPINMKDIQLLAELEYDLFVKATLDGFGGASINNVEISDEILHKYFMQGVEWATSVNEDVSRTDIIVEEEKIKESMISQFKGSPDEYLIAQHVAKAAQVVFGYGSAWCIEHRKFIGDLT